MSKKSKVVKCENFSWNGVEKKVYKTDTDNFKNVHRYTLLGDDYNELNFQTRYFELQADGYSSLEYHKHPHSVVVIRGSGSVILNDDIQDIRSFDVIYISPGTIHQFHADNNEPLGFLCTVDRYRDRPVIPDNETISEIIRDENVLNKIKK
ncbi:MAG: cupin domain-containing protein [Bacteroidetes bacterium]|jgi:quercetin dioxygenase-like cupin family protein|nr:cupin domain-containing protein [Bacteroidota bacterium]